MQQVANLSDEDIANIDDTLNLSGRVEREDWIGQAKRLVAEKAVAEVPADDEKK